MIKSTSFEGSGISFICHCHTVNRSNAHVHVIFEIKLIECSFDVLIFSLIINYKLNTLLIFAQCCESSNHIRY